MKNYKLQKYVRSNQDTCIHQRPIVWPGEVVESGQIIADGPGTNGSELALGQNLLVAYMPWEGYNYNYEDAFVIIERLLYDDLFTSLHIETFEVEIFKTKSHRVSRVPDLIRVFTGTHTPEAEERSKCFFINNKFFIFKKFCNCYF